MKQFLHELRLSWRYLWYWYCDPIVMVAVVFMMGMGTGWLFFG